MILFLLRRLSRPIQVIKNDYDKSNLHMGRNNAALVFSPSIYTHLELHNLLRVKCSHAFEFDG